MSGPDAFVLLAHAAPPWAGLLAYGPGPEVELIPYFLSLLTWVGLSLAAVLLWPVAALLRRFRAPKGAPPAAPKREPTAAAAPEPPPAPPADGPAEGGRGRV